MRIEMLERENEGLYRCTVETRAGTFYEDFNLSVSEPKEPSDQPILQKSVNYANRAELECRTSLQPPIEVVWSRHHGTLPREAATQGSNLIIPSVREEDAGAYTCEATTEMGAVAEVSTILVVTGVVPYFAQAPISYKQYRTLPDAYLDLDISISFKPESEDGLIFYNGNNDLGTADFVSFGLNDNYPEFRFNVGSGVTVVKADKPIEVGQWHTVKVARHRKNGSLTVDQNPTVYGVSDGKFQGLDLLEPFYLGGLPSFYRVSPDVGHVRGFVGCISRLMLGSRGRDISTTAEKSVGITGCETCAENPCDNGGICQESHSKTGYVCLCSPGFSGEKCSKVGDACFPGVCGMGKCEDTPSGIQCYCPIGRTGDRCRLEKKVKEPAFIGDSYVAYSRPKHILRRLHLAFKFKAKETKDSVIFYCAQDESGQGDFASVAIKDKHLEFRFDTGSGPAILRSKSEVEANKWHEVKIKRKLREGSLVFDKEKPISATSPGNTRGLNIRTPVYVGGLNLQKYEHAEGVGVTAGFYGCISELELGGKRIRMVEDVVDSANIEDCDSMSPCDSEPCENEGMCLDLGNGTFACSCQEGFRGDTCQEMDTICEILTPCFNGGGCSGNISHYECQCPWGLGGRHCNKTFTIGDEIGMKGSGYLELSKTLLPHASAMDPESFSFTFSTLISDALLIWQGQDELMGNGGDFIAVALRDGFPILEYELGDGPVSINIGEVANDDIVHKITIEREGKAATLIFDDIHRAEGKSQGALQMLNTRGNIFLGGGPGDVSTMTGGRFTTSLTGCFHSLSLANIVINFEKDAVTSSNIVPCSEDELTAVDDYDYSNFYTSLLDENMDNFDEDDYLERLNRLG